MTFARKRISSVDSARSLRGGPLKILKSPHGYSPAEQERPPLKQTAIIFAFAALTVVPPAIAGLRAAPSPQAEAPVAGVTGNDFFSLAGAFCVTRPTGERSAESDIPDVPERTPSSDGNVKETYSSSEARL